MASYHFRVKTDTKPNGKRISASVHVDYISRQGKYKNEGADKNLETNFIAFANKKNLGEETFPMYLTDDFGKILYTPKGLQVSGKYTPTTLSIALTLAKNISDNQPLILNGSQKFKRAILKVAMGNELDIQFADENLQRSFYVTKARKKFEEGGGKIVTTRSITKSNFKKFLSSDEVDKLVAHGMKNNSSMRWNFSAEQQNYAELTAKKILQNLDEVKTKIFATSHFEYINREKAFANRGDCIFTDHHLPKWANDNPKNFFKAADRYEGKNRRRYVEIEFSLPNELTSVEDYKKIIEPFIDKHLKNHYYAYAIHDKLGVFSGERHPHCHIMFSERLIDEVEKIQGREPQNFFKYPARKKGDGSEPSFVEKYLRGAPKSNKFHYNSKYVEEMRADFAKIQNEVLAEKGFSIRVSHKSLKAQRDDAIKNGDEFLAKVLDREAEEYLSPLPLDDESPRVKELKKSREERGDRIEKLFADNLFSQKTAEEKIKKSATYFSLDTKNLLNSTEVKNSESENLQTEIIKWSREISALRRMLITTKTAEQQAMFEYLSKGEQKLFKNFLDVKSRRENLQKNLRKMEKPDYDPAKSFDKICEEIRQQIKNCNANLKLLQPDFEKLEEKLQSPSVRKNINFATHNILKQNKLVREKLKIATENLILATEKLRDEIFKSAKEKYELREAADILFQHYLALKKDREKLERVHTIDK